MLRLQGDRVVKSREELVELIAGYGDGLDAPNFFNPWRNWDPQDVPGRGPIDRRLRLLRHFSCFPRFLLIGEAPGYQGCHFSGVPFTNEALLCEGTIPRVGKCERFTTRFRPWREPSATIVWSELHKLGIAASTCMWNAFAWHPHEPGDPMTNRTPTKEELRNGAYVLLAVLKYFEGTRVIAVGNQAEWTLNLLGIKPQAKVRHPSMGGANQFRQQLSSLCSQEICHA